MHLKRMGLILSMGLVFQANWLGMATAEELRGNADKNIKEAPIPAAAKAQTLPVPHASTAKPSHSEKILKQMPENENMKQEIKKQKTLEEQGTLEEQKAYFKSVLEKLQQSEIEFQKTRKEDIDAFNKIISRIMFFNGMGVVLLLVAAVLLRLKNRNNERKNPEMDEYQPTTTPTTPPPENSKSICIKHDKWIVAGVSATGKSHLKSNPPLPCQDSHIIWETGDKWGIAVVCDGAGSAKNSHYGSAFVAAKTAEFLEKTVNKQKWYKKKFSDSNYNKLPSHEEWYKTSRTVFSKVLEELDRYSKTIHVPVETLACTVISVIYSPVGILIAHIGDGRAAYCNAEGQWKPMMAPCKGEEANQTVFITSPIIWNDVDKYMESRVVKEDIVAFALMSDGCESHSFEVNIKKPGEEEKYYDPNKPYDGFFNPLVSNLQNAYKNKTADAEIGEKWGRFIEGGNSGLMNELDDKTMIIGTLIK